MGELDGKVFSLSGPSSEVHAISKNYIQTVCFLWPNLTPYIRMVVIDSV